MDKSAVATDSCKDPGVVQPVVDRNRCEAKGDCVAVCPYDVFDIRKVSDSDKSQMTLKGRIKSWAHGGKQAHVIHPEACHSCGQCVTACPEHAIQLRRMSTF